MQTTKNQITTVLSSSEANTKPGYIKTKIGWIPDEWQYSKLEKVVRKITVGIATEVRPYVSDSGVPIIRNQNIKAGRFDDSDIIFINEEFDSANKNKRVKTGDVIIVRTGSNVGKACVVPERFNNAQTFTTLIIRTGGGLTSDFLSLHINSYGLSEIERLSAGAGKPNLNAGFLKDYRISFPPLPEQRKIAKIFSTWDRAIEHSQKLVEQLKTRKKGLMQQLLTGKTRLKGFSGAWKKYQIGELASNYNKLNSDNEVQEVLSCTKYDGLVRSLEYFGRKVFGDDLSKYKVVPYGHFAYATNHIEEGSIGYQDTIDFGLVSPMYTVFKTNKKVDDSFFYKLLKTDKLIYYYQSNMSGSIARRGGLRWNVFETIVVKIPSIEEQTAIANVLTAADNEIKTQENYLAQLQAQKKGLMQQLLTGQKRVKL